jgi:hypothetical protein
VALVGLGIDGILGFAGKVIDKIFPSKDEAEKAKVEMAKLAMTGELESLKTEASLLLGQMAINQEEAKHASWFVAGWRPFIGWICGGSLGYYFVAQPFLVWILSIFGVFTEMPKLDIGELMIILGGMLGLGGMRTYERVKKNGDK